MRVWFEPGSNTAPTARFVPEEEAHIFAEARMKYSMAYKGGYEAADRANFDSGHTQHRQDQKCYTRRIKELLYQLNATSPSALDLIAAKRPLSL